MGRRRAAAAAAAIGAVLLAVAVVLALRGGDPPPAAGPAPSAASPAGPAGQGPGRLPAVDTYLVVGDSLAAGYQPSNPGDRTDLDGGYAGLVRDALAGAQASSPELVNLGCPGETTGTLAGGGLCPYDEGSQLAAAQEVLAGRPGGGAGTLVTVQVGANDVQRCVVPDGDAPRVDEECVSEGLAAVRDGLPGVLEALQVAAPQARVVVLDYYNPFEVTALLGPQAQPFAVRSAQVQAELNAEIARVAAAAGADVAAVGAAFDAQAPTDDPTVVGPVCSLTWMCAEPPDIHATSRGYAVMAREVLQTLDAS